MSACAGTPSCGRQSDLGANNFGAKYQPGRDQPPRVLHEVRNLKYIIDHLSRLFWGGVHVLIAGGNGRTPSSPGTRCTRAVHVFSDVTPSFRVAAIGSLFRHAPPAQQKNFLKFQAGSARSLQRWREEPSRAHLCPWNTRRHTDRRVICVSRDHSMTASVVPLPPPPLCSFGVGSMLPPWRVVQAYAQPDGHNASEG